MGAKALVLRDKQCEGEADSTPQSAPRHDSAIFPRHSVPQPLQQWTEQHYHEGSENIKQTRIGNMHKKKKNVLSHIISYDKRQV